MGSPAFFTNHLLPQTEAWVSQVNPLAPTVPAPSGEYVGFLNALIAGFIVTGNWYILDRMWIFAAEQKAHAQISIVNPNGLNAAWPNSISEVNAPGWNASQGYTGSIVNSSYLNTNYNPSVAGGVGGRVNFTDSSAAMGMWVHALQPKTCMGVQVTSPAYFALLNLYISSTTDAFPLNATTTPTQTAKGLTGFYMTVLSSGSNYEYYNGVLWGSGVAITSSSLPNYPHYILASNAAGTAGPFSTGTVSAAWYVSGAVHDLYGPLSAFAAAIGF